MATQKILQLVIITFISMSMATNIQASLIEPTITTTIVSQTFLQQNERDSAIPEGFKAFAYGMNGNWNLLELCLYDETMSVLRPIQTGIAANDKLSYIPFTEGSLQEKRFEFNQYDWEAICEYGITPLSIQSSLGDTGFSGTELDELYDGKFVARALCYGNDIFYDLSTFFEDSERIVITYNSEPNISSAAVPEPTMLVLLSIGTLVVIRKRR